MTGTDQYLCRLTLVRPELDPGTRQGNDFGSNLTYLVQFGIILLPLIIVRPAGASLAVWLVGLVPLGFAAGHYLRGIHRNALVQKDRSGFATLSTDQILFMQEGVERILPLDPRTEISLTTRCFLGKPTWSKNRPIHSGIATFKVTNGLDALPFQVVVSTEHEERALLEVIRSWYRAGYTVRESVYSGSSFLLRTDLTYAEVQRLKSEYGLKEMWPVSKPDPHSA